MVGSVINFGLCRIYSWKMRSKYEFLSVKNKQKNKDIISRLLV